MKVETYTPVHRRRVQCDGCNTSTAWYPEAEAIAAWNKRAEVGRATPPLTAPRFYVNDIPEFCWEIVDRLDNTVVRSIDKTSDDSNRDEAEKVAAALNASQEYERGILAIAGERFRQVSKGFTPEHDDQHTDESLAACAMQICSMVITPAHLDDRWNHARANYVIRTHPRLRQLAIAGALIAAEIDRLQRLQSKPAAAAAAQPSQEK